MNKLFALALVLAAGALQDFAKDGTERPLKKAAMLDEGKTWVELPLKKSIPVKVLKSPTGDDNSKYAVLGVRAAQEVYPKAADPAPGEKYDLGKTGIQWHKGIDAVVNRGKPILLLQILGNFDDVYC